MKEYIPGFTRKFVESTATIQITRYSKEDGEKIVCMIVYGKFKDVDYVGDCERTYTDDWLKHVVEMYPHAVDSAMKFGDLSYHWADFKELFPHLFGESALDTETDSWYNLIK